MFKAEGNLAEEIVITTNENEKYHCLLPVVTEDEKVCCLLNFMLL